MFTLYSEFGTVLLVTHLLDCDKEPTFKIYPKTKSKVVCPMVKDEEDF